MKIRTEKIGGIWHGYLEGHAEVDERGLTEEIAREKVERLAARLEAEPRAHGSRGGEDLRGTLIETRARRRRG